MNPLDKYITDLQLARFANGEARVLGRLSITFENPIYDCIRYISNGSIEMFVEAETFTNVEEIYTKAKDGVWQQVLDRKKWYEDELEKLNQAISEL